MEIESRELLKSRNRDTARYSVWVYDGGETIRVFDDEMPNTTEVWFEFYSFNQAHWKIMEEHCMQKFGKGMNEIALYNFCKVKLFMIEYMLAGTSIPIKIERDGDRLCKSSLDSIMRIHPRIMRIIMSKVSVFPDDLPKDEKMRLDRQCSKLFGDGSGIMNPHEWISTYCNLTAFWEKFGLNYFDIMRLPHELFSHLKTVMSLESSCKSKHMEDVQRQSTGKARQPSRF